MEKQHLRQAFIHHLIASQEKYGGSSLKRVQQTAYLIQETSGIPTAFRYRIRYGSPSSDDVENTLSYLKLAGYIRTRPHQDPKALDIPVETIDHPHQDWPSIISPYLANIGRCLTILEGTDDRSLDMMASAHITHASLSKGQPAPDQADVVRTVKGMKPRYEEADIAEACQALLSLNSKNTPLHQ